MGDIYGISGPARRKLMRQAAATAVLLSALFVVVYGGTNWLTAQRPGASVSTWFFEWELTALPYVPLLIVPYMSIDLFFFFAAFLCRDERELRVFARRVVFSILTAAAFFLLMPFKLVWPTRPPVEGIFGDFVETSCTAPFLMEYPHNLFPAMHITLCLILADLYGRHTRGILRGFVYFWFGLIGLSTVLTWQHHLVDVAGGLVLGGFAFYLFRESSRCPPVAVNVRIGCFYAAGAMIALAAMPLFWPWGIFLLWPAASLGLVSGAYFGLGPSIFRKTGGCLPVSARFVLAPILMGQYLSLIYYRRQCRAWNLVAPGLIIGRVLNPTEAAAAMEQGVTAVLDLTAEFTETTPFRKIAYRNLPILDLTAPTPGQLRQAVAFINAEAAQGIVYVHCKIGYSRSAAVAGAYLLASQQAATAEVAVNMLRKVRPSIIIRNEAMEALESFSLECKPSERRVSVG